MRLNTKNGKIAVNPFVDTSVKTSLHGTSSIKVARIENKVSLVAADVLFDSEEYKAGTKVLVRGDLYLQPWAKEVFTFEGVQYILMPKDKVEAVIVE